MAKPRKHARKKKTPLLSRKKRGKLESLEKLLKKKEVQEVIVKIIQILIETLK